MRTQPLINVTEFSEWFINTDGSITHGPLIFKPYKKMSFLKKLAKRFKEFMNPENFQW